MTFKILVVALGKLSVLNLIATSVTCESDCGFEQDARSERTQRLRLRWLGDTLYLAKPVCFRARSARNELLQDQTSMTARIIAATRNKRTPSTNAAGM